MKSVVVLVLIVCTAAASGQQCTCGVENVDSRIVGGKVVKENKYPWMVLLSVENNQGDWARCGGSIINNFYVLTAAHCLEDAVRVRVGIGGNDASKIVYIEAQRLLSHPGYNRVTVHNDIAIVKLSRELPLPTSRNIQPICLPTRRMQIQGPFTVAGWGETESGELSEILLETSVYEYPWDKCNRKWDYDLIPSQFCASVIGKDSCSGDSGGPLVMRSKGRNYAVGVVSFGGSKCGSSRKSVYTRVTSFLQWIYHNTRDGTYCSN